MSRRDRRTERKRTILGARWDRFDIAEAFFIFALNNHTGQFSKEYAIHGTLKAIQFKPKPSLNDWTDLTDNGQAIYFRLTSGISEIRDRR